MNRFFQKYHVYIQAVLCLALLFTILFKSTKSESSPTDTEYVRAKYVMYCIRDVLGAELRAAPDKSPEGVSIILGCTESGFDLYPKE